MTNEKVRKKDPSSNWSSRRTSDYGQDTKTELVTHISRSFGLAVLILQAAVKEKEKRSGKTIFRRGEGYKTI